MSTYTIRDLDEKTRQVIHDYAAQHHLNTADAIQYLIFVGRKTKTEKKYKSFFEIYEKVRFKGGKNLSANADDLVYK
jgi:hypothetical protein